MCVCQIMITTKLASVAFLRDDALVMNWKIAVENDLVSIDLIPVCCSTVKSISSAAGEYPEFFCI